MILAAYCPRCEEVRARSRDLPPGSRPQAADFEVIEGQDRPVDGEPATCTKCTTGLVFRRVPVRENGHAGPEQISTQQSKGIVTLFALESGEEIKATKEVGRDVFVIFTNRRIVRINLNDIAEEA